MSKKVQIDLELFMKLVSYHCIEIHNDSDMNNYIKIKLEDKLNRLVAHDNYSKELQEMRELHEPTKRQQYELNQIKWNIRKKNEFPY